MTWQDGEPDLCDYTMSDTAICEARRVGLSPGLPYGIGFRRSTLPRHGRPTLKRILALDDEQFRRFIQNDCQFHGENRPSEDIAAFLEGNVSALLDRVEKLEAVVRTLGQQAAAPAGISPIGRAKTVQGVCGPVRGLDIEPR